MAETRLASRDTPPIVVGDSTAERQRLAGIIRTRRQRLEELQRPLGKGQGAQLLQLEIENLTDALAVLVRPRPVIRRDTMIDRELQKAAAEVQSLEVACGWQK